MSRSGGEEEENNGGIDMRNGKKKFLRSLSEIYLILYHKENNIWNDSNA